MPQRQIPIKEAITKSVYFLGQIQKSDLEEAIKPYSSNPDRLIRYLKEQGKISYERKNLLIKLKNEIIKLYNTSYNTKPSKKLVNSHSLITFKSLLYFLSYQEIEIIKPEKSISGTSLNCDLYLKLTNGFEVYIEADTGTEGVTELRHKILNYQELEPKNKIIILITKLDRNYQALQKLVENKPQYKVILETDISTNLPQISLNYSNESELRKDEIQAINEKNIKDNNNLNLNNTSKNYTYNMKEIEKQILSL